jgi:nicotinamide-nucleotide amidase
MTRASILAVGTELTQGQITNRNATWISDRLTNLGIEVVLHLTVPDDHTLIREALDAAAMKCDLVFVTGGLGPTTDDFTRDDLANWIEAPLEFRAASWEKIVRRLTERGIEVAESNRIQCFFPRGSYVLENLEGTADGFLFSRTADRTTTVVALPGPPREGQHLWDNFIGEWLVESYPAETPADLETWHCLGKSESALGEIVETAVSGFGVKTGYRASMPYVEVKIWIPSGVSTLKRSELIANLDVALAPYSVSRNGADLATGFAEALRTGTENLPVHLLDLGTAGRLTERLVAMLRSDAGRDLSKRIEIETRIPGISSAPGELEAIPSATPEWFFFVFADGEVTVVGPHGNRSRRLPNPYPSPALADRLGGYRAEVTLKAWTELLRVLHGGTGA